MNSQWNWRQLRWFPNQVTQQTCQSGVTAFKLALSRARDLIIFAIIIVPLYRRLTSSCYSSIKFSAWLPLTNTLQCFWIYFQIPKYLKKMAILKKNFRRRYSFIVQSRVLSSGHWPIQFGSIWSNQRLAMY